MTINVTTSYEIGQTISEKSENGKILSGTIVRIEIIVLSDSPEGIFIDYLLDNGGKIRVLYKSPSF